MSKEAMKLALMLEALEPFENLFKQADEKDMLGGQNIDCQIATLDLRKLAYATADLRKALAQQLAAVREDWGPGPHECHSLQMSEPEQPAQQEPVAWMYPDDYERMTTSETFCTVYSVEVGSATRGETTVALYTSPPTQRKPLTDGEIDALREQHSEGRGAGWRFDFKGFARAIEAAHGIKGNT